MKFDKDKISSITTNNCPAMKLMENMLIKEAKKEKKNVCYERLFPTQNTTITKFV